MKLAFHNRCPQCQHKNYEHDVDGCGHVEVTKVTDGAETHTPCKCLKPHPMYGKPRPPLTEEEAQSYLPY